MLTIHASINGSILKICSNQNQRTICIGTKSDAINLVEFSRDCLYWELLPHKTMIDAKLYCEQRESFKATLQVNRSSERQKVPPLHDNARPRRAKVPG